jgi:hypothetical protein
VRAREHGERLVAESGTLAGELAAARAELAAARSELAAVAERLESDHRATMEALRVVRDDDAAARARLWELRETPAYQEAYEVEEPLVSVLITTYRNYPLLKERSLPSVLGQTYENLEVIVVGDSAPPEAGEVVASFGDPRLRYVNLPYRGPYPEDPASAWLVSGTTPFNTALALARGRWIASNSDDDAFKPTHVESLLGFARRERAEVAYGVIEQHAPDGDTSLLGTFPPQLGQWGIQCSVIHAGLRFLALQPTDWLFGIPNDWSLAERMLRIGTRFAMLEQPVVDYYPSYWWSDRLHRASF